MEKLKRYSLGDRQRLMGLLPLDKPISLTVEASSLCNLRCKYCGRESGGKSEYPEGKGVMSYDCFKRLVDGLHADRVKVKALNMARLGEPLINKHLPDMIAYAKSMGVCDKIILITNGLLLNKQVIDSLLKAGCDKVVVSIQGLKRMDYLSNCGVSVDLDVLYDSLSYLYSIRGNAVVHVKGFVDECDLDDFYIRYSQCADEVSVERISRFMNDVDYDSLGASKDVNRYGLLVKSRLVCPLPFYSLSVLSSGRVSACCVNNDASLLVGDIYTSTIMQIWKSSSLNHMRVMMMSGKRDEHSFCSNCEYPEFGVPDEDHIEPHDPLLLDYYSGISI